MTCAIILPGSGSDDRFVRTVFARPLASIGVDLLAPPPVPGAGVVAGYRAALDAAAASIGSRRLLVGGISLGAHVAVRWATSAPSGRLAGVLVALPAWTGSAAAAPAAQAALVTAAHVRSGGVAAALAAAGGAPAWLVAELARAWRGYGDGLADALEATAVEPGPAERELGALRAPVGVAALVDDPVHPLAVARRWADLLPRSALVTARMEAFGADPEVLGRAAVLGWLRASG